MKKLFSFSVASALVLYLILGLVGLGEAAGKPKPPPATPVNPVIVYVAVSSSGPYNELAVANEDGSNQTALLSSDQVGYFFPAWSPDLDLILVRVQVETNYPRPCGNAAQALRVGGQFG